MEWKMLAKLDYHIDESDPDIVVLRRQDGSFVAALSAHGVTREGIVEAAREDYSRLREANLSRFGQPSPKYLRRIGGISLAEEHARKRCPSDHERRRYRTSNVEAIRSFCQAYSIPVPGYL